MSATGDLRESAGYVEVFNGAEWLQVAPLNGLSFEAAAVTLSAPADASPDEIARWAALTSTPHPTS